MNRKSFIVEFIGNFDLVFAGIGSLASYADNGGLVAGGILGSLFE